jgi:hypothetical protein
VLLNPYGMMFNEITASVPGQDRYGGQRGRARRLRCQSGRFLCSTVPSIWRGTTSSPSRTPTRSPAAPYRARSTDRCRSISTRSEQSGTSPITAMRVPRPGSTSASAFSPISTTAASWYTQSRPVDGGPQRLRGVCRDLQNGTRLRDAVRLPAIREFFPIPEAVVQEALVQMAGSDRLRWHAELGEVVARNGYLHQSPWFR